MHLIFWFLGVHIVLYFAAFCNFDKSIWQDHLPHRRIANDNLWKGDVKLRIFYRGNRPILQSIHLTLTFSLPPHEWQIDSSPASVISDRRRSISVSVTQLVVMPAS